MKDNTDSERTTRDTSKYHLSRDISKHSEHRSDVDEVQTRDRDSEGTL